MAEAIRLALYGWHAFRHGLVSNLHEPGVNDESVRCALRHAKPDVTKECYIAAFDPAVLAAIKVLETTLDTLKQSAAIVPEET